MRYVLDLFDFIVHSMKWDIKCKILKIDHKFCVSYDSIMINKKPIKMLLVSEI